MIEATLARIAGQLSRNQIPYCVIGGQAVLLYGSPRLTADIDITVGIGPESIEALQQAVVDDFTPLAERPEEFAKKTMVFPIKDKHSGIRIDLILSFTPYEKEAIRRARNVSIRGTDVAFASPEDVIVHKLFAGRPRDIEDAVGILSKQPEVDLSYIREWLGKFAKTFPEKHLLQTFKKVLRSVNLD